MQISLKTMTEDAVIYADSEEINGFAVLLNGGLQLILHSGLGIIGRLLTYETYAMNLKKNLPIITIGTYTICPSKRTHRAKELPAN